MPVFITPRNSPSLLHQKTHENKNNGSTNTSDKQKESNRPKTGQTSFSSDLLIGSQKSMSVNNNNNSEVNQTLKENQRNNGEMPNVKDQKMQTKCQDYNDENKQLYMCLNSIVLQYLGNLGLHQTISCFIQESDDEGYPLPPSLSTAVDKFSINLDSNNQIRPKDVNQLLKHFDEEDIQPLLDKWKYIRNKCSAESRPEEQRLNVHIRIYVYITIPFRQNYSEDDKQMNIQSLINEFKSKNHDDCNDPEILSLYAIPFVSNPVQHPVFSKFFTTSWIEKLRKNLATHCQSLCKRLPDPFETDLAKLYRLFLNTTEIMQEFHRLGNDHHLHHQSSSSSRNPDNLRLVPTSVQKICQFPEDSLFKTFFDNVIQLKEEHTKMQNSDRFIKTEYMEKIQLCDALVTCLKELYMTREGDATIPWERILQKCSQESNLLLSEYSLLPGTTTESRMSTMVHAPCSSQEEDFEVSEFHRRPPQSFRCVNECEDNKKKNSRVSSSRYFTSSSQPNTGRQFHNEEEEEDENDDENANCDEPTLRAMRQMLTKIKKSPSYENEGVGDFKRVIKRTTLLRQESPPLPPPPPSVFDRRTTSSYHSPRRGGLIDMMETNNMLRNIVRDSEYL